MKNDKGRKGVGSSRDCRNPYLHVTMSFQCMHTKSLKTIIVYTKSHVNFHISCDTPGTDTALKK